MSVSTFYNHYSVRWLHIRDVAEILGCKLIADENISRGKYNPHTRTFYLNPNMSTAAMYNFVFKHEVMHYLESKKGYTGFKDYCFKNSSLFDSWAREKLRENGISAQGSREEVISRYTAFVLKEYKNSKEISKPMRDRYDTDLAEREVLADFVGDTLLGTGENIDETLLMIQDMAKTHRNILERIIDWVKDTIKRLKVNSHNKSLVSDLEYLNERLGRVFDSENKQTADIGGEQFSISYTVDNRPVVVVNDDITKGKYNDKDLKDAVRQTIVKFKKVPIKKQTIYFTKDSRDEYTNSKYTKWIERNDRETFYDKMRVGQHPQDIIYATTDYINEGLKHPRKDNIVEFARGKILLDVRGNKYEADVVIGFTKRGVCELHDIVKMVPITFEYKRNATPEAIDSFEESNRRGVTYSKDSITSKKSDVNNNISKTSENDTEQSSISVGKSDYELQRYERGAITREEYLESLKKREERITAQALL